MESIANLKTTSNNDDLKNELNEKIKKQQLFLIDIAINQIQSICKKIELNEANNELLNMVCACLVNYWITSSNAINEPTGSIKANGYSINKNSKEQTLLAQKLFDHWRSRAAHLLIDEGFAFFTQKELIAK